MLNRARAGDIDWSNIDWDRIAFDKLDEDERETVCAELGLSEEQVWAAMQIPVERLLNLLTAQGCITQAVARALARREKRYADEEIAMLLAHRRESLELAEQRAGGRNNEG